MGDASRSARFVVTASSLRAGIRSLLSILPQELAARREIVELRARFAADLEQRPREGQGGGSERSEREVRELTELGERLATACWTHHDEPGRLGQALVRLRTNVSLAKCYIARRSSLPPPMSKIGGGQR